MISFPTGRPQPDLRLPANCEHVCHSGAEAQHYIKYDLLEIVAAISTQQWKTKYPIVYVSYMFSCETGQRRMLKLSGSMLKCFRATVVLFFRIKYLFLEKKLEYQHLCIYCQFRLDTEDYRSK